MDRGSEFLHYSQKQDTPLEDDPAIQKHPPRPHRSESGQARQSPPRATSELRVPQPHPSGPEHVRQIPRVYSELRASPSVEPPRIDRYLMYGSPANDQALGVYVQPIPAVVEHAPSTLPQVVRANKSEYYDCFKHSSRAY
jgi:hypothetical protein